MLGDKAYDSNELRDELEEAKKLGTVERAEQAEEEIDALTRELSRAVGLGGRNRRAASTSERARQSVSKAIKGVVDRLAQHDPSLGHILSRCIKVGTFCSYQPDPHCPMEWECTATPGEVAALLRRAGAKSGGGGVVCLTHSKPDGDAAGGPVPVLARGPRCPAGGPAAAHDPDR